MTLFLINGPPRSGKDTVVRLMKEVADVKEWKLAAELKERAHLAYRLESTCGGPLPHAFFESSKDVACEGFRGLTPREVYIQFHERWLKPLHGPRILGELLVQRAERLCPGLRDRKDWSHFGHVAVSDAGDTDQCLPLVEKWGANNVVLVHLERPGVTWTDNRRKFFLDNVKTVTLVNTGDSFASLSRAIRNTFPDLA